MERVVILKRQHSKERLGLGVAIESDEEDERVLCVTVEQIDEDSISHIQGLAPGDRIWKINGTDVHKCKRIECLSLFQCAPLLLNLVVSTPYKKISKIPWSSDIATTKQPYLDIRRYNHLSVEKHKGIKKDNQEALESDYQTITTDQPSVNSTEMSINEIINKIEDRENKESSFNQSSDITKKNFSKKEVQGACSPLLSLINTSSTSSISPDPHSPTHSEDSGFQNDHTTTVKSKSLMKVSTSPVPVPINYSKTSAAYNTTSSSPTTTYKSVFARTPDSVDIGKNINSSKEGGFVDQINNCTKTHLNGDKMFGETTDYYMRGRNSNTLYGYMDCKMSKNQNLVLNKIVLPTGGRTGPAVPPKPKMFNNTSAFSDDINCLKTNKIFSRASIIYSSDDTDKQDKSIEDGDGITSPKKIKPKVSSLIQKFQSGNIGIEDSDEEVENITIRRSDEGKESVELFQTDKDSISEIILQEDFIIEQDRCSGTIINSQNINNLPNISLSKREVPDEINSTYISEDKFKSLAEKYREPSPTKEIISPALKELLEKDNYDANKTSSPISTISKTNLSTKSKEISNIIKEDDILPNITSNSSTISSRNSTPVPTIEKFNLFPPSSCNIENKKENCYFTTSTANTTTDESINNKPIENTKHQYVAIENIKQSDEQKISPTTDIIDSNYSSRSVSRLSNSQRLPNLTQFQIEELQEVLKDQFEEYELFVVNMTRVAGIIDGSVGIILTGAESTSNVSTITIQRVITGSVADREGTLLKGDRLFYIQGKSTVNMSAADARKELKAPAKTVTVVAGRLNKFKTFRLSSSVIFNESENTFNGDPNLFTYSEAPIVVSLTKNTIGVGFSLDGGVDSSYGNRPIIVKRLFNGGEALKSGLITAGDILEKVEDTSLEGMTYLDAWKLLKALPEGKINLSIRKIQK
uniref:PDZ domain-containing protein n=1 Tax=Strongyloides papillosus TaxID=174720 RepID=A0A0N5BAI1_STREA